MQAQKFREALEKAMLGYTNKQISTAQMIAQLLELAKWVREAKRHGEELGLKDEETAFYDALAENGSAKEVMKSDQLRLMARALAEMVKKMPKLDWTQRESVRADLRRKSVGCWRCTVYPPDLSEDATPARAQAGRLVDGVCQLTALRTPRRRPNDSMPFLRHEYSPAVRQFPARSHHRQVFCPISEIRSPDFF